MTTIKLIGGLGNQMFQYAAALSLADKFTSEPFIDLSWFNDIDEKDTKRHYELDCFALKQNFVNINDFQVTYPGAGRKKRLKLMLEKAKGKQILTLYKEPAFEFNKEFNNLPDNTYLEGYFQSEKYFLKIRPKILKAFSYNEEPNKKSQVILDQISNSNSISIHVRRGDYVTNRHANKFHGLQGLDYYQKAVGIMSKRIKQPVFFVFSDDIGWCKTNLPMPKSTIYVTHNKSGSEDMRLMRECKHNIIANSSFSWWGAWLGEFSTKKVIVPKQWFNDTTINTKDVVPVRWQKI